MRIFEEVCKEQRWVITEPVKQKFAECVVSNTTVGEVLGHMKQLIASVEIMDNPFDEQLVEAVIKKRNKEK